MNSSRTSKVVHRGLFTQAFDVLGEYRACYFLFNVVYYGLLITPMAFMGGAPFLNEWYSMPGTYGIYSGIVSPVTDTDNTGSVVGSVLITFGGSLFVNCLILINVPSAIIPLTGPLLLAWRALVWGVVFNPNQHPLGNFAWIYLIAVLIESQAYILAAVSSYVHNSNFLKPEDVGATSYKKGYVLGAVRAGKLYVLVAGILLVSALFKSALMLWLFPLYLPVQTN